jgi:hypothetical protein
MNTSKTGLPLPEGITLQQLIDNWNTCETEYASARRRMRILDMADRGAIWDIISRQFPEFQINPDTNYVSFVKDNIVASVYTVGRCASLMPKKAEDQDTVDGLNRVLDNIWGTLDVAEFQLQAGERAALVNLGITQVGWDADITGGTSSAFYKGDIVFKNIDPMNYFRDPFAESLDTAAYVIYFDQYHKSVLMEDYHEALEGQTLEGITDALGYYRDVSNASTDKNYFRLIIHWVRTWDSDKKKGVIHEIHTIDNKFVVRVKSDIQPSVFPFAELYGSIPVKDPVGVSEASKILSSSIVLNLLDGITVSHAYKAHRPPKLISDSSGLNIRAFKEYGNDPDKAFMVRGDATKAVQYVTFPNLPQGLENISLRLSGAIERMSGIDGKYTGKDTGSILTTGGIDSMLAQATMRDTTRIRLYEKYSKRLTRLVLHYLIEFGDKRKYAVKSPLDNRMGELEVDFPKIPPEMAFNYSINIDAEMPKNKARMAAAADVIIEKSMQYQANPPIMTAEEWFRYQDFPQKDLILDRLKSDRSTNITEQVAQILSMFATLTSQGLDPNQAVNTIVQQLQAQQEAGPGAEAPAVAPPQNGMMPQQPQQPQGGMPMMPQQGMPGQGMM